MLSGKDAAMLALVGACTRKTGIERQILVELVRPSFLIMPKLEVEAIRSQVIVHVRKKRKSLPFKMDGRKLAILSMLVVCDTNLKAAYKLYMTNLIMPYYLSMNVNDDSRIHDVEALLAQEVSKRMNRKKWTEINDEQGQ